MTVAVFVDCSGIGRGNEGNLSQKCKGLGTLAAAQSTKLSPPSFEYSHRLQNSSFVEIWLELDELLERFPSCNNNEKSGKDADKISLVSDEFQLCNKN